MHSLRSRTTVTIALIALVSRSVAAQEPQCSMANPNATAACNTAVDAIRAFHPLAGMIVSGGNPVLGTSGSLAGIGHLTVTARVTAVGASFPIPAVSVSWMPRTLPRIQYGSLGPAFGTGDPFEFSMDLKADNYRAVASWKFVLVDLAAGLGIDHYSSSQTTIRFYDAVLPTSARTIVINPTNTREVLFADAGLSLAAVKLVAELGFQTGKDQPCAHYGKTPPCTDAIVAAGVARVVAAIRDPDPEARGGADVLRVQGVAVAFGVLAEAAAALNAPFLFAHQQAERPFVALKLATSIDGRIPGARGSPRWVSGGA